MISSLEENKAKVEGQERKVDHPIPMLSVSHLSRLLGHQQGKEQGDTHQLSCEKDLSLQEQSQNCLLSDG